MTDVRIFVLDDLSTADAAAALHQRLADSVHAGHRHVVVDLRAAALESTATISTFCGILQHTVRPDVTITITGASARVRRVLEMCAIDGVGVASTAVRTVPRIAPAASEEARPAGPDDQRLDARAGSIAHSTLRRVIGQAARLGRARPTWTSRLVRSKVRDPTRR